MLDDTAVADAARRLLAAERDHQPVRQLSLQYPEMTVEDAYAIQRVFVNAKLSEGRRLVGRKIGLTSRAMQAAVSINEPDFGALFDDMTFEDGAEIPIDRFIRPRVEVEQDEPPLPPLSPLLLLEHATNAMLAPSTAALTPITTRRDFILILLPTRGARTTRRSDVHSVQALKTVRLRAHEIFRAKAKRAYGNRSDRQICLTSPDARR